VIRAAQHANINVGRIGLLYQKAESEGVVQKIYISSSPAQDIQWWSQVDKHKAHA